MKPERWQQVDRLLQAALEVAPAERGAFLDAACKDDPALRHEVEALLACDERAGSFIQSPAIEVAPDLMVTERRNAQPGQQVGPYRIVSEIGAGGMGQVFLAVDTRLGRKVALKVLLPAFTQDEVSMGRFRQEARAILALNHPNIITVYEIGHAEGLYFIATEYVDGVTLRQHLAGGRMSLSQALDVAIQVASALAAAHQAGIVHRDIKPENIMLRPDGYVKVLDFGLAKLTDKQGAKPASGDAPTVINVHTTAGMVMGTAAYMSPEQARGRAVDERTDLFSLGVALYEMVTGRAPFQGETVSDLIAVVLTAEPLPLRHYRQGAPQELERMVTKALAKERERRYQNAKDLLDDLQRLKRRVDFASDQQSSPARAGALTTKLRLDTGELMTGRETGWFTARSEGYRKARLVALALLALACVVGALAYYFTRGREQPIDSIAVLPFINVGGESDGEYLSDSLAENLMHSLARLPQLRVAPRSRVFRYKGQAAEPHEVGRKLGVRAVLAGRVTQRGESLRIEADLVDVERQSPLWSAQYTRPLAEMPATQKEILMEVARRLRLLTAEEEQQWQVNQPTINPDAYLAYARGLYLYNQFTPTGHRKAFEAFHEAVRLDPDFAQAHAAIARIYAQVSSYAMPPREAMPKAEKAVLNALALDESLADAHWSLALIRWWSDWDYGAAEREFKRSLELNPNQPDVYGDYANLLARLGRTDEAVAAANRAIALDPVSPANLRHLALVYYYARQYDRAIEQAQKALELDSRYDRARHILGMAYAQKGMYPEALAELQQSSHLPPGDQESMLGYAYAVMGRRDEAVKAVAELEAASRQSYISPYLIACVYAGLGDKEQALRWLERSYEERNDHLTRLKVDPTFDGLRSDPRFANLMRRVGLLH